MDDRRLISNSISAVLCWHHGDLQRLRMCLEKGYCDLYPIGDRCSKWWNKLKSEIGDTVRFSVKGNIVAVGIIQSEPYDLAKKRNIQPVAKEWSGAVDIENVRFLDNGGTCNSTPRVGSHRL